jgi:hypothetical protein
VLEQDFIDLVAHRGLGSCARLRLIPPFADEFYIHENTDGAREWALNYRYLLATGVTQCAHGFYMMKDCPANCRSLVPGLDHANLWVPSRYGSGRLSRRRPFLLSAPCADQISDSAEGLRGRDEILAYAKAHGLYLPPPWLHVDDNWYGHGKMPIRLELSNLEVLWPIEEEIALVLAACPVPWPDEGAEGVIRAEQG